MKRKVSWYAAGVLLLAMVARAGIIIYNSVLVNTPALAYNNTYTVDLQSLGIGALSAQAVYSSATISNATFQDGAQSTGSFTVLNYLALSSASASNSLTIVSNAIPANASIAVPGYVFFNGIDWAVGNTSSNTAQSIKTALATVPWLSVSASGSVVYATATYGSLYNSYGMTSNTSSITVTNPRFTGGRDNAYIAINGARLTQGRHWTAATSNAVTATSLASAINGASLLNTRLTAAASGGVVSATSTINGAGFNYLLQTSTPTALSASGSNMVNGTTPGFALGGSVFTAVHGSGLSLALPVLYSGTPAIGGLTAQTTYYAVPTSGNSFMLAKYSTSAVAGNIDLVVVTSTSTQLLPSQHTYTLAPLPITGTPGLAWTVSNDGVNFTPVAIASVTINSYTPGGANVLWSFGYIGSRYLRLNVTAPATGGLNLNTTVIGTN